MEGSENKINEGIAKLPSHIAIIMDGNGRWAGKRGLPRVEGHKAGTQSTLRVVKYLNSKGIKYTTLFSFSTENWKRPKEEIKSLLKLFEKSIEAESKELEKTNIRLKHIGRLDKLPGHLREAVLKAIDKTKNNSGMTLTLAFDYGGRSEIADAIKSIIKNDIPLSDISEETVQKHLYDSELPDVDLLIRTSGEYRISNFLLWQTAYSELYFTDVLWPDFDEAEMDKALKAYSERKRRFGGL